MASSNKQSFEWDRALGLASAALAVGPLALTGAVARLIGVDDRPAARAALRLVGTREAAAAGGLLALPRPWMLWGRVAGDAMDLALLGRAMGGPASTSQRVRTAVTAGVVAAITATDVFAATQGIGAVGTDEAVGAVTVNKPASECYGVWTDYERLPTFMTHLDSVSRRPDGTLHWVAAAPLGQTVEWDAEIVSEAPDSEIAWRAIPGADIHNEGTVTFRAAPGGGTEIRARVVYRGLGPVAKGVSRWTGQEPHQQLDDDLRRFKQVMETGEVVRSDGALGGKQARSEFPQRPAQPASKDELAAQRLQEVSA